MVELQAAQEPDREQYHQHEAEYAAEPASAAGLFTIDQAKRNAVGFSGPKR